MSVLASLHNRKASLKCFIPNVPVVCDATIRPSLLSNTNTNTALASSNSSSTGSKHNRSSFNNAQVRAAIVNRISIPELSSAKHTPFTAHDIN